MEAREGAADVLYGERRWVEEWIMVGSMVIVAILPGDAVELVEIVQYNCVAYLGLAAVGLSVLGDSHIGLSAVSKGNTIDVF